MEALRSTWTDERLDDLNGKVDDGFSRVDRKFERVDVQFKELRAEMNDGFGKVNARFDALQLTLIRCAFGLGAAIILLVVSFVLTGR
jgi:hypothetical protein